MTVASGCGLQRKSPPPSVSLQDAVVQQMEPFLKPWRSVLGKPRPTRFVLGQDPGAPGARDSVVIVSCDKGFGFPIRSPLAVQGGNLAVGVCNGTTELTVEQIAQAKARADAAGTERSTSRPEDIGGGLEADFLPMVLVGQGSMRMLTLIAREPGAPSTLIVQLEAEKFCAPTANRQSMLCTDPRGALAQVARGLAPYLESRPQ